MSMNVSNFGLVKAAAMNVVNSVVTSTTKAVAKNPKVAAAVAASLALVGGIGAALKVRSNKQTELTAAKNQHANIPGAVAALEILVKQLNVASKSAALAKQSKKLDNGNSQELVLANKQYDATQRQLAKTNEVAKDKFTFSLTTAIKTHRSLAHPFGVRYTVYSVNTEAAAK